MAFLERDNVRVHRARVKSTTLKPARERAPCATHCYVAIVAPKRPGVSGRTVLEFSQFVYSIPKVYAGAAAYCKHDIAIRLAFYVTDVVLCRLVILNLI